MSEYKLVPGELEEFAKGDTDPSGDCGKFVAGINHNQASSSRDRWGHRIEVYGDTPEHAEELRDRVLRALAAPDVAVLVEALENAYGALERAVSPADESPEAVIESAMAVIDAALAAHRKQGGEV